MPKVPHKALNAMLFFVRLPGHRLFPAGGGMFGLSEVETPLWGGLLVTLVISFVGITVSLPLGILLALGRRSKMPVVKMFVGGLHRSRARRAAGHGAVHGHGHAAAVPAAGRHLRQADARADRRCLFSSAYMAEVIRGGLQAIPKGQYEGADSLGLGYWQKMGLIVMPQALKLVIPGIVNSFISLFKDTSLVYIIGMFDLLGIVRQNFSDAAWASPPTPKTGLIFAAFVFWVFCFAMSRYSQFMERQLETGHKQ